MVDPGEDFQGYMEGMAQVEADRELYQRHEHWRQTTWGGFLVRKIQSLARNIEPTVSQIALTFGENDSASSAVVVNLIRFVAVLVVIVAFYVISQLWSNFLGKEIIVEEEIVILHEFETEEEAEAARKKNSQGKMDKGNKMD